MRFELVMKPDDGTAVVIATSEVLQTVATTTAAATVRTASMYHLNVGPCYMLQLPRAELNALRVLISRALELLEAKSERADMLGR